MLSTEEQSFSQSMIFDALAGIKHILHTKVTKEVPQGQVHLEMWDEAVRGIRDQLVSLLLCSSKQLNRLLTGNYPFSY